MDVEEFIQCVKNRPILYDRSHKHYKNIAMKNKVWESIAKQMNETSDVLRIKWKGLKDGYTKYRKQRNSSPGSSVYSKLYYNWCWAEDLKFLEICAKRKQARPNASLSTLDDSRASDYPSSDPPMVSATPSIPSTGRPSSSLGSQMCYPDLPEESQFEHTTSALKPRLLSETSLKESSTFKRSRNYTSADEDDDKIHCSRDKRVKSTEAIDLLFKSYAESFKYFSIKTQVALKVKLAQLFADAEVEDANVDCSVEFVSPVFSIVKVESEHDYALSSERSTLEHQVTAPQNAAASFGVTETSEFSYLFKNSPASVHSSNDSQIIEEENFPD